MVQGLKRFEESVGERPPVQQQTMGWMVQGLSLKQKAGLYPKVSRLTLSLGFFSAHQRSRWEISGSFCDNVRCPAAPSSESLVSLLDKEDSAL